jgi:hypothetical protein
MVKKEPERARPNGAKEIRVTDEQRFVLYQIVHQFRARDASEIRALNAVFRDFDLEEIEAKAKLPGGVMGDTYGARAQGLFVPESTAIYLSLQMDRLGEIYPAGKTQAGIEIPAGLPVLHARMIAPILDQLDAAFPRPPAKAKDAAA